VQHLRGRVAAMLELGMGFHPDFHRPQNAFDGRGQARLLRVDEIAHLMPEIEGAFAETEDYIEPAVRVYSSVCKCAWPSCRQQPIRPDVVDRRRSAVSWRCLFPT